MKLFSHTVPALVGIAIAGFLVFSTETITGWWRNSEPIENWVDMRSVYVPDHIIGDEETALVVYDRDIKREFIADWTVKALQVNPDTTFICEASGKKDYLEGEKNLPDAGITLEYIFRAHPCKWVPGQFFLQTTWIVKRDGYKDVIIRRNSNVFNVLEPGAQMHLSPEQVQKLEQIQ